MYWKQEPSKIYYDTRYFLHLVVYYSNFKDQEMYTVVKLI